MYYVWLKRNPSKPVQEENQAQNSSMPKPLNLIFHLKTTAPLLLLGFTFTKCIALWLSRNSRWDTGQVQRMTYFFKNQESMQCRDASTETEEVCIEGSTGYTRWF